MRSQDWVRDHQGERTLQRQLEYERQRDVENEEDQRITDRQMEETGNYDEPESPI